jgi:transcriptional regulator with XRE-family HTH domain
VWQLENKKPARPSGDLLLKLAKALSVSPDFLLDDSVEEPTTNQTADALFRKVRDKKLSKRDIETLISIADSFAKKK